MDCSKALDGNNFSQAYMILQNYANWKQQSMKDSSVAIFIRLGAWSAISLLILLIPMTAESKSNNCGTLVGLTASFEYGKPNSQLPRVEVRHCGQNSTIELLARDTNKGAPPLTVSTGDFSIVQAVVRSNVFLIETGGATRDQVFVFEYTKNGPQLALRRVTKGTAEVTIGAKAMDVRIVGIYAGDAPPKTETYRFTFR